MNSFGGATWAEEWSWRPTGGWLTTRRENRGWTRENRKSGNGRETRDGAQLGERREGKATAAAGGKCVM